MEPYAHEQLIAAVGSYSMPRQAVELLNTHPPLLIAGVTAAGKDTITQEIIQNNNWRRVISHTNRPLRPGERNGENYWFASDADIFKLINSQAFIDIKVVHEVKVYGTTIVAYQQVLQSGHKPILVIDIQGAKNIIKYISPNHRPVFILPPDFSSWVERMENQGPMSHAERIRRLHSAKAELKEVIQNESYLLFVNRDISITAHQITSKVEDMELQHQNRRVARQLLQAVKNF